MVARIPEGNSFIQWGGLLSWPGYFYHVIRKSMLRAIVLLVAFVLLLAIVLLVAIILLVAYSGLGH
jgi:hypothetical protein